LTVKEALDRALIPVAVAIKATLSKEETNASGKAKAELIVGKKK